MVGTLSRLGPEKGQAEPRPGKSGTLDHPPPQGDGWLRPMCRRGATHERYPLASTRAHHPASVQRIVVLRRSSKLGLAEDQHQVGEKLIVSRVAVAKHEIDCVKRLGVAWEVEVDRPDGWRSVIPGVVVATAIWTAASIGFTASVSSFSRYNGIYGTLGAAVVPLLWFTSLAILLGAG